MSHHISSGTRKSYKSSFRKFVSFCSNIGEQASTSRPETIASFIKSLFDDGASYNSVNVARSAISKHHVGFDGVSAGSHPIVCKAVKAVFRLRPPLPKYQTTFDIQMVFDYIKSLQPNPLLSLKLLTYKTLFLLTSSSISRVSSVSVLGPDILVYKVSGSYPHH